MDVTVGHDYCILHSLSKSIRHTRLTEHALIDDKGLILATIANIVLKSICDIVLEYIINETAIKYHSSGLKKNKVKQSKK